MKNTTDMTENLSLEEDASDLLERVMVLGYGILSYVVGCFALFWLLLGVGGIVPVGISDWQANSVTTAFFVNLSLIVLFGVQHSVMARRTFKNWLTQHIPQAAERATYMLASGVVTLIAVYFWQSLPGIVWQIENNVIQIAVWALYVAGLAYLLLSTLVTNHFELMGLRQVYLYFRRKPYTPLPFTNKFMYRYSRHPMMLGMLIIFWAAPLMTVTHLIMAIVFTLYILIGVYFEEKDLSRNFGDTYRKYKAEISAIIPGMY